MTFIPVPGRASGDYFTESMWDRYVRDNMNKGVMRPIANTLLSSGTAAVHFSSVPADFEALLLSACVRGTAVATIIQVNVRFNDDASGSYDLEAVQGAGATPSATEAVGATSLNVWDSPAFNSPANAYTGGWLLVLGAARAGHKFGMGQAMSRLTVSSFAAYHRGFCWRNNAPISKVSFLPSSGNFLTDSRFTLYGLGGT